MKAAIIGAGFIAEFHAVSYQALEGEQAVGLCAVCAPDREKAEAFARRFSCRAYTDAQEMLERERPELVSVCVPTHLHEQYTVMALEHGAHVLCEKPMALTREACGRMEQTARRTGRLLMIGQMLRWWPEYRRIAAEMRRMGPPELIVARRLQHASRTQWMPDPNRGGGVLFDLLVHDLDMVCALMGVDAQVLSACGSKGPEGSWRRLCVTMRWPSGTQALLEVSNRMPPRYPFTAYFRADYPQAALEYQFHAPLNIQMDARTDASLTLFENGEAAVLPVSKNAQQEAFAAEIAAFVQGVRQGSSPLPCGDSLRVMGHIFAIGELLAKQA